MGSEKPKPHYLDSQISKDLIYSETDGIVQNGLFARVYRGPHLSASFQSTIWRDPVSTGIPFDFDRLYVRGETQEGEEVLCKIKNHGEYEYVTHSSTGDMALYYGLYSMWTIGREEMEELTEIRYNKPLWNTSIARIKEYTLISIEPGKDKETYFDIVERFDQMKNKTTVVIDVGDGLNDRQHDA